MFFWTPKPWLPTESLLPFVVQLSLDPFPRSQTVGSGEALKIQLHVFKNVWKTLKSKIFKDFLGFWVQKIETSYSYLQWWKKESADIAKEKSKIKTYKSYIKYHLGKNGKSIANTKKKHNEKKPINHDGQDIFHTPKPVGSKNPVAPQPTVGLQLVKESQETWLKETQIPDLEVSRRTTTTLGKLQSENGNEIYDVKPWQNGSSKILTSIGDVWIMNLM